MMTLRHTTLACLGVFAAVPAQAQDRAYCPQRPALGTPACTMAPGKVSVETALTDWTLDNQPDQRTDTIAAGSTFVRVGLSRTVELQAGWQGFGHVRQRDSGSGSGAVQVDNRVGDVVLGFKANVRNPDGKRLSIAIEPNVTLPVGRNPVGAGTWAAGLVVPVTYDLSDTINLQTTSEIDAAANEDGSGRHFAVMETIGVGIAITKALNAVAEGVIERDEDPQRKTTHVLASTALAWMVAPALQLDLGAIAGVTRAAPRIELYWGVSKRF